VIIDALWALFNNTVGALLTALPDGSVSIPSGATNLGDWIARVDGWVPILGPLHFLSTLLGLVTAFLTFRLARIAYQAVRG